jgi:DNA ligase (NAD+)
MKAIAEEVESLREQLRRHEHLYYVLDQPEITDAEYDALMRKLQALETQHPELATPDSPTRRVGGRPREGFLKVRHSSLMLSLENALNEGELRDFGRRVRELLGGAEHRFVVELKLDGLSMAAHYGDGKFTNAITRGDGVVGDEVVGDEVVGLFLPFLAVDLRVTQLVDKSKGIHAMIPKSIFPSA